MIELACNTMEEILELLGFPITDDLAKGALVQIVLATIQTTRMESAEVAKTVILAARMGDIDTDLRSISHILEDSINAGVFTND